MRIQEIITELGDNFRELVRHYSSEEWTATAVPREFKGQPRKIWKPKTIMRGGKTPTEAMEKLLVAVKEFEQFTVNQHINASNVKNTEGSQI